MRRSILVFAFAFATLASLPAAAQDNAIELRYVVGTDRFGANVVSCQGWPGIENWGVNAGCQVRAPRHPYATITVTDGLGESTRFHWYGTTLTDLGYSCYHAGSGYGSVSIYLVPGCTHVTVSPDVGSFAGTIRVS